MWIKITLTFSLLPHGSVKEKRGISKEMEINQEFTSLQMQEIHGSWFQLKKAVFCLAKVLEELELLYMMKKLFMRLWTTSLEDQLKSRKKPLGLTKIILNQ